MRKENTHERTDESLKKHSQESNNEAKRSVKVLKKPVRVSVTKRAARRFQTSPSLGLHLPSPVTSRPQKKRGIIRQVVYNPPVSTLKKSPLAMGKKPQYAVINGQLKKLPCRARKERKEIIHAMGVAGSRVSRPTYDNFSNMRCS